MRSLRPASRVGHDGRMTSQADSAVFAMLFATIGTVLIVNQPPQGAGFVIFCAAASYAAAAVFFFRAIVAKR